jgi:hypothetical protein
MEESGNDYNARVLISVLTRELDECISYGKDPAFIEDAEKDFKLLNYHINDLSKISGIALPSKFAGVNYKNYNEFVADSIKSYLLKLKLHFRNKANEAIMKRQAVVELIQKEIGVDGYIKLQDRYKNKRLDELVKNINNPPDIYETNTRLIRKTQPVFMIPDSRIGRSQFYAPYKVLGEKKIPTLLFNLTAMWIMVVLFFIVLYFNLLKRFINWLESLRLPIWRKFGRQSL